MDAAVRRVVVVGYAGIQALDAVGPLEVLAGANAWLAHRGKPPAYRIHLAAPDAGPLETESGYALVASRALRSLRGELDTVIIAGGSGSRVAAKNARLQRWLCKVAQRVRRLCSVCTGAFVLAEAGLLDGRRATTHWAWCERLQARYPAVRVEADPIFVRDGHVYTSAGVTAGIDLALALVEQDLGAEVARVVARHLVVFLQRPGGQSQFSTPLRAQPPESSAFRELQAFIAANPEADLSVEALAARVAMSPRHFARRFRDELGITPAQYVRTTRVEAAQRRLEQSSESIERIAERSGFGSEETMRRAFVAHKRVAPRSYRQRFGRAGKARATTRRTA